jgi:hypothetical protein
MRSLSALEHNTAFPLRRWHTTLPVRGAEQRLRICCVYTMGALSPASPSGSRSPCACAMMYRMPARNPNRRQAMCPSTRRRRAKETRQR